MLQDGIQAEVDDDYWCAGANTRTDGGDPFQSPDVPNPNLMQRGWINVKRGRDAVVEAMEDTVMIVGVICAEFLL